MEQLFSLQGSQKERRKRESGRISSEKTMTENFPKRWNVACVWSHFSHVWLCDPRECSHQVPLSMGILQARIVEWVSMLISRGSSFLTQGLSLRLLRLLHWKVDSLFLSHQRSYPGENKNVEFKNALKIRLLKNLGYYQFKYIVITKMFMETSHPHSPPNKRIHAALSEGTPQAYT